MSALALLAARKESKAGATLGPLVIEMRWEIAADADVDLWVRAPGDNPVGYSRLAGIFCNLVRDDLGRRLDPESRNEEMTICRAAPAGEWIVNTMLYDSYDQRLPIRAELTVLRAGDFGMRTLLRRTVWLRRQGEELTVWRFTLDRRGDVVAGSVNDLFLPLRAAGGAS